MLRVTAHRSGEYTCAAGLRPTLSVEDAMITDIARSPYVLLSVSVLLGSAMYPLALIVH